MEIVPWGVRGSYPVTMPEMQRHGGNTLCFEVRAPYTPTLIVDAGTGLVPLGRTLPREGEAHVFISHMHLDHVQGLPFFAPVHNADWTLHLYVPRGRTATIDTLFDGRLFPLRRDELLSSLHVRELEPGVPIQVGGVSVTPHAVPHPGGSLAFLLATEDETACVISDIEVRTEADRALAISLLRDRALAFVDAHFIEEEYRRFTGWGHTPAERWLDMAMCARVQQLVLTHHAPHRTDADLDALQERLAAHVPPWLTVSMAVEGHTYSARTPVVMTRESS